LIVSVITGPDGPGKPRRANAETAILNPSAARHAPTCAAQTGKARYFKVATATIGDNARQWLRKTPRQSGPNPAQSHR